MDTCGALNEIEISRALALYNKSLFWEYSEREIPNLSPELVIPRITRYGTLEDIIALFVIYPADIIQQVVDNDRELDETEKTVLRYFSENRPQCD